MLRIPVIRIKDKQAFSGDMQKLLGKPVDVAKRMKEDGFKLIHIIDADALSGSTTNLDIYDHLTYFINVEVECAPKEEIVRKLLSLKCRVVLAPGSLDLAFLKEKNLLVARIKAVPGPVPDASDFHDVIIESADDASVERFVSLGKRVIVSEADYGKLQAGNRKLVWGVILVS